MSAYPDPRVSGRVALSTLSTHFISPTQSLPVDLLLAQILSKSLLALSLFIARDWLLAQGFAVLPLNALVLGGGAIGLCVWERVWDTKGRGQAEKKGRKATPNAWLYAVLVGAEGITSLLILTRLSLLRHVMLTSFSILWARGLPLPLFFTGVKRAQGKTNAIFITIFMVLLSYTLDSVLSSTSSKLGYGYVLLHLLITGQRTDLLSSTLGDESAQARFHALATFLSFILSSLLAVANHYLVFLPSAPTPAHLGKTGFTPPSPTPSLLIPCGLLLSATCMVIDPLLTKNLVSHFSGPRVVKAGWFSAVGASIFVGLVGFGRGVGLGEGAVGGVAWLAISHLMSSDPRSSTFSSSHATAAPQQAFLSRLSTIYRHFRSTIKTILLNPDSKRIYFFLCLNLGYMVVQMVYGIWTNSLGLISDSIHMFFDCLALGMGLFASVMSNWRSNEEFTYGYSRVETLSGFANGLFLCLISIFIVFEAIERLLSPPEMNTSQLLVVSSVGLAVNLVGMAATGGHHHHGHSHGHDHGPAPATPQKKGEKDSHDHSAHDHSAHDHSAHDHSPQEHDNHDHARHEGHAHSGHSHNMKGVFLHVMADTLGSVGVIISTLLINQYGWTGFDPLASIFIAVLIFASVVPLVVDSGKLLVLDIGEERESEVRLALNSLNRVEGLSSYTFPRFWSKDPESMIGSICIQLAPSSSSHDPTRPDWVSNHHHHTNIDKVTARVNKVLKAAIGGLEDLVIQVEPTAGFGAL